MSIKEELNNGSFKSCTKTFIYCETSTGNFCTAFKIKNIKVCTDIPVSLWFKIKLSRFRELSKFNVFCIVLTYRNFRIRNIRNLSIKFLSCSSISLTFSSSALISLLNSFISAKIWSVFSPFFFI